MAGSDACFSIFSYIASASGCGIVAIIHIRIVVMLAIARFLA